MKAVKIAITKGAEYYQSESLPGHEVKFKETYPVSDDLVILAETDAELEAAKSRMLEWAKNCEHEIEFSSAQEETNATRFFELMEAAAKKIGRSRSSLAGERQVNQHSIRGNPNYEPRSETYEWLAGYLGNSTAELRSFVLQDF